MTTNLPSDSEGQYLGHATLLVPDGVAFKVLVEVRAVMRVEMLMLHKPDFDWLLTFYPPPMERLRDELTDWVQVLQWISLPKVYVKKIRRIVQQHAASIEERAAAGRSPTLAGVASSVTKVATGPVTTVAAAAGSTVPAEFSSSLPAKDDATQGQPAPQRDRRPSAGTMGVGASTQGWEGGGDSQEISAIRTEDRPGERERRISSREGTVAFVDDPPAGACHGANGSADSVVASTGGELVPSSKSMSSCPSTSSESLPH